jgi:uncharacterized protein YbgA (DUF1722 family)
MKLMTREETILYHMAELERLEEEGCEDESLLNYHRENMKTSEDPGFDPETAANLAQTLARLGGTEVRSVEEMRKRHEAYYENEARLREKYGV